jgi:hypothetical protein
MKGEEEMKLSSSVCASIMVLTSFALAADVAVAAAKVKSHSNTNNNRLGSCPAGEVWNATTNKCAASAPVNEMTTRHRPGNNKASIHRTIDSSSPK